MPPAPRCRRHPFALPGWLLAVGMAMAFGASAVRAEDAASPLAAEPAAPRVRVVDITLSGLPDEEAANARLGMTLARLSVKQRSDLSEARLQFLLRRIPGEVTKALEPFGWYSPMVDVRREPARDGVRIRVSVDPGEPVRVKTLDADITGEARDDRFVMRELPKLEPDVGERFVHLDYEASKFRVERKLADRGYFEAKRTTARVAVSRAGKTADVLLRWESGPRHAMGEARFAANQFRPGLLPPLVDWTEGEPYHRNKLDRLRARLSQLDYFALVEVVPAEDGKGEDQRVPIDITTTPAKRTAYTAALRFGSDTGVGVRGSMNRRWVNDRGHKWLSDFEWSQRRSGFTTQYRVPSLRRLPGWWGTRIEYLAEDPESALGYERLGVGAGWQGRRDPYTLSGRVVFAEERTKLLRRDRFPDARQTMLYPELSATYRRVEDPLNPDDSLQLTMTLRAGVIEAASRRERFAQMEIGAQWLHSIGDSQAVILRADAATTTYEGSLESLAFPTSLRYFAGGDRSIRGYGYREIGPRFEGEVLGGLHRIVASAEYQYFFTDEWGAAVFVDAGDVFNTRRAFDPKIGVGVGARWRSPVGLVGVDVAQGLDEAAGGGTRLHLSFGVGF
ncbi:autotransporter assembly complex family protein [Silanimonas sp.]|uniref:autotransporter assembly complex family protein n=1 Tax=Silanimonas sp. TaxID=1929290 RepID=UPI0037C5E225